LALRHLALPSHRNAVLAGAAAECARQQGRFWAMHDGLFRQGFRVSQETVRGLALALRLDLASFDQCLGRDGPRRVAADSHLAAELGITGTPTLLLGRRLPDGRVQVSRVVRGAVPVAELRSQLDALLTPSGTFASGPIPRKILWAAAALAAVAMAAIARWYGRKRSQVSLAREGARRSARRT